MCLKQSAYNESLLNTNIQQNVGPEKQNIENTKQNNAAPYRPKLCVRRCSQNNKRKTQQLRLTYFRTPVELSTRL